MFSGGVLASVGSGGGDPHWDNVVLFLDGESLADLSDSAHTITETGTVLSSTQAKFGSQSLGIVGGTNYLTIADSPDWHFGTGDFTIDFWMYCPVNQGNIIMSQFDAGYGSPPDCGTALWGNGDGGLQWWTDYRDLGNGLLYLNTGVCALNQWNHFACVRVGDYLYVFVNGALADSAYDPSQDMSDSPSPWSIGGGAGGNWPWTGGFIDHMRITKGIGRWSTNFTPPTIGEYGAP